MNCPYEIVAVVPWGTETWGLKSWSVLFKLRQSPTESGSTSTPVPLAGALHKCAILHFTFLEQTGTGEGHGHFFGICENVLAANNRELSTTGINHNGIYHLTWTELQRDVTARSVAQECKDSGSVLLSCVLASSNGCFSPSLPDGWSSYRSTPKYIIQQWKRKEFWLKKIIREKYSQKPPRSTFSYISLTKLATYTPVNQPFTAMDCTYCSWPRPIRIYLSHGKLETRRKSGLGQNERKQSDC